jgi:alkanesulfonate monooxygenase SsuD/methylene tetrahydromethanopterin reductase-like flavin-dependent oxidoreductase (luciferase family)
MPATAYADARRRIVELRAEAGMTGQFCFSYSCGGTRLLDRLPDTWPAPASRAPRGSEFRYAPQPWVDADNRPRLVGTPDQVTADLRLLEDAGVEHVTLRFGSIRTLDLERFASEVLTAFDDREG